MVKKYHEIYILTREGKEYSEEGCYYVENMIREKTNDQCEFIYSMGAVYNDTKHMKECLINNLDSYVVISMKTGIGIIFGDLLVDFNERLTKAENKTSWEVAVDFLDELNEYNAQHNQ